MNDRLQRFEKEYRPNDPEVRVAVEVRSISGVDPQACSAQCEIQVHAEWEDATLKDITLAERDYDFIKTPQLEPTNAIDVELVEVVYPKPLQSTSKGLVHMTSRFRGEFSMQVNERELQNFPLDVVNLVFIVRPTLESTGDFGFNVTFDKTAIQPAQPKQVTFFRAHEFYLCEVKGRLQELNGIKCVVRMKRQHRWFTYKVALPTVAIQILSWVAGLEYPVSEMGERLNWLLNAFLAQSALLYVVSESIPKLAYLTLMDKFLSFSAFLLFVDMLEVWAASHVVAHDMLGEKSVESIDFVFHRLMPMLYFVIMYRLIMPPYLKHQQEPKPIDETRFVSGEKKLTKEVKQGIRDEMKSAEPSIPVLQEVEKKEN